MKTFLTAAIVVASLLSVQLALAQSTEELRALRKELEAIKEGQGRLQKDVQEIFIGVADGATVRVARAIKGAMPFAAFKEAIDATLAAK